MPFFDFEGVSRVEVFDQFGRIHDAEHMGTIGLTLRQALGHKVQKQIARSRKRRPTKKELRDCHTPRDVENLSAKWIEAHLGYARFAKQNNLLNSAQKFCVSPIERTEDFYVAEVGQLSKRQIDLGICKKQVFDVSELIFREHRRMKKLLHHIAVHGTEIFDGYAHGSWPSGFIRPLISHIRKVERESVRDGGLNVDERLTDELFPHRADGISRVGMNGKGLRICKENHFFSDHRLETYFDYWSSYCTNHDVYCNEMDTATDAALEIEAIINAAKRYKAKKWTIELEGSIDPEEPCNEDCRPGYGNFQFLVTCRLFLDRETETFMNANLF